MADPRLRIRVPASGKGTEQTIFAADPKTPTSSSVFLAKEWCISDDVLNISDAASVNIANVDGENTGKFHPGQLIIMEESDPDVAQGHWLPVFKGRIVSLESGSDLSGGSVIHISAMDLGWHLTSCHGEPLTNLNHITFGRLLDLLIDPTWGFGTTDTTHGNALNRQLKQGRIGVTRLLMPNLGGVLPYIQVEPGQAPFDILKTYAAREGVLINMGVNGELVLFRPDYSQDISYVLDYHASFEAARVRNNVIGKPSVHESIDGLYSEVQCWSTTVIAPSIQDTADPNASFRRSTFTPAINPLPFFRRHVFSDTEAIRDDLRVKRAIYKQQMDQFMAWTYQAEFPNHSQRLPGRSYGTRYASDTMIGMNDSVHGVTTPHYVAGVETSFSLEHGTRARLTIRKPILNPALTALPAGAKRSVQSTPAAK